MFGGGFRGGGGEGCDMIGCLPGQRGVMIGGLGEDLFFGEVC